MSSLCKKIVSLCLACILFVTAFTTLNRTHASDIPLSDDVISAARELCKEYNVDPALLWAIIECESNFKVNNSVSSYRGLMAVSSTYAPTYAKRAGMSSYNLLDPVDNIHIGLEILKEHMDKYGDSEAALTAYCYGGSGVKTYYKEHGTYSSPYSRKVTKARAKWAAVEAADAAAQEAERLAQEAERLAKEAAEREAAEKAAREAEELAALIAAEEAKINEIATLPASNTNQKVNMLDLRIYHLSDLFV